MSLGSRTNWALPGQETRTLGIVQVAATISVGMVAVIAAAISFGHIEHLGAVNGQPLMAARALPVSVDGAVVASSLALLDAARRGAGAPRLARVMLVAGIAATLAANGISGLSHGPVGVIVAMLPALSFIGSVEVLLGIVRGRSRYAPETVAGNSAPAVPEAIQPVPAPGSAAASRPPRRAGSGTPKALPKTTSQVRVDIPAPEKVFADVLAAGRVPGVRAVKREMRCGQDRATQIIAELAAFLSDRPATIESMS
jgi:Protein of unknown function (DUF2637)